MRYALLGPVKVSGADGALEINGTLRRTLLAALLLRPNQVVSADHLAELLWGDRPRVSATTSLYNQVMRLRQALGPHAGRVRAVPPGYLIDVEPGELDTVVFADHRAAAALAAQQGRWAAAAQQYTEALNLWRGEPLADVPALQSTPAILQLAEERILAVQGRIEADLHLGRHDQVIGELRTLINRHPWREAFHAQLMLALHRAGRQPEALDVYRDLRRAIAAEFGVEPSDAVRDMHTRILRADPELVLAPHRSNGEAPPRIPMKLPVPLPARAPVRQLPADTRAFTGREAELDALIAATRGARGGEPLPGNAIGAGDVAPTVVISAINGMGGIGKTTLAVRAAHRLAEHYPDGQLFIDLHGHSADLDPITPQDALDYLLRSIGLEPQAIPQDVQERAALYRSRLAGTRTLIVLDNARNPAQVKPLIPAEPGCLVLVTSRTQLTGLDDAEFLSLDALPPEEAVALLASAAGPGRVERDDASAGELTEWCGRLPLAIRIIGARLRHRPMLSPAALLETLRTDGDPLALLKDDDRDVTRVFASSLDVLPDAERQLFARLGLVPGPDFDAYAAAALQDTDVAAAEHRLESLFDHSLLIQHKEGRYRLHDLLRAYARIRAAQCPAEQNEAALQRLFDYYVGTAAWAGALWSGADTPGPRPLGGKPSGTDGVTDGRDWFDAEVANLLAAFGHEAMDPRRKLALAGQVARHLKASGPWYQLTNLHLAAVEIARVAQDPAAQVKALVALGNVYAERGLIRAATDALESSLELSRRMGDRVAEAHGLEQLAFILGSTQTDLALSHARAALRILSETGNPGDQAGALNVLTVIANQNCRFEESVAMAERFLALSREVKSRHHEGAALFHLSHAYYGLGRFDEIEPVLQAALRCHEAARKPVAVVVQELGRLRVLRGEFAAGADYLESALKDFTSIGFLLGMGWAYGELGRIRLALGDTDGAQMLQETALRLAVDSGSLYLETFIRANFGYVHIAFGRYPEAAEQLRQSLEVSRRGGFRTCQAEAMVGTCALVYARDGAAEALPRYREALDFVREFRHPREEAAALVGLGRCESATGDRDAGTAHLHEAVALYERMGSAIDVAATRRFLTGNAHELDG